MNNSLMCMPWLVIGDSRIANFIDVDIFPILSKDVLTVDLTEHPSAGDCRFELRGQQITARQFAMQRVDLFGWGF